MENPGFCFGMPFLLETPDIPAAVALCQREGLRFVELNSNFPQCLMDVMKAESLRGLAREVGIFFTLHLDDRFDPFDFNRRVREAYQQTMLDAIRLCLEAEIPLINMHLPKGNIVTLPDGKHTIYQEFGDEFMEAVCQFRDLCNQEVGSSGLHIAVENADAWAPYEQAAILQLLESPVFGLCLDIGHDHACQNQDLTFITKHRKHLRHMHAHDGWDTTNHQALGTGEIPLNLRLSLAKEENATVVIETKTVASLSQSVSYLRSRMPEMLL